MSPSISGLARTLALPGNKCVTKREVVLEALAFRPPPYVPWAWDMTKDCQQRLRSHLGADDLTPFVGSHFLDVGSPQRRFAEVHDGWYRDAYGVALRHIRGQGHRHAG